MVEKVHTNVPASQRIGSPGSPAQGKHGLSWAALFNRWMTIGAILLVVVIVWYFEPWAGIPRLPLYWLLAIPGAFLWMPYFDRVNRMKATRLVVYEGPGRMTLYRVGKRTEGFRIDGEPVTMTSRTGVARMFVTGFDAESKIAVARTVNGTTPLDQLQNADVFGNLAEKHIALLEEDRLTRELVGVKVAQANRENSEKWVRIGIAAQSPEPILQELDALELYHRGNLPDEVDEV